MNDKIILENNNKISISGNCESKVNAKLKQLQKINIKKELMNLKPKEVEEETLNTNDIANKTKGLAEKTAKGIWTTVERVFGTKGLLIFVGILIFIFLISSVGGAVGSILSISEGSSPRISEENKTKIIELMKQLDSNCSKNLKNGFALTGSTDTDWKTVLALLLGYYENDLTNFNEAISGGDSWKNGDVSENGLAMIKTFEGFSSVPYNLGDGTMTIGYGTTSKYDPIHYYMLAPKCTELQASNVLMDTLKKDYAKQVLDQINKSGRDLSDFKQYQFDALVSFQYNEGSIQDEVFWKMFCNGDSYEAVAEKMKNTKIGFGGGVVTRRKAEAHLFATGEYPTVSIFDYGTGTTITASNSINNNSIINKIYNLVNEVSPDHGTLTRHDFDEVIDKLNFTDEQKEMAIALFEADLWEEVFGEGFDFRFNLNGTYLSGGILGDYVGLSVPRQEILSIAQQICDLQIFYLWGGREYDMNKPINQVSRMDCSGFTGYLMAKVFGATYYNGINTFRQINYCYEVPADQALPGDIVFNHSLGHTLIYAGEKEGKRYFYHAPSSGKVIQCSTYHNNITFHRLKNVDYDAVYDRRW